jgi:hypothetical protein
MSTQCFDQDNHGPATMRGVSSGPPRAAWVGSAVGLAQSITQEEIENEK